MIIVKQCILHYIQLPAIRYWYNYDTSILIHIYWFIFIIPITQLLQHCYHNAPRNSSPVDHNVCEINQNKTKIISEWWPCAVHTSKQMTRKQYHCIRVKTVFGRVSRKCLAEFNSKWTRSTGRPQKTGCNNATNCHVTRKHRNL